MAKSEIKIRARQWQKFSNASATQESDKRFDQIDKRMERIERRMDKLDDKIERLADKIDALHKDIHSRATSGTIANISTVGIALAVIYSLIRN